LTPSVSRSPAPKASPGAGEGRTGTVIPISTATNTVGRPIHVGVNADQIAITPDGKTLYVGAAGGLIGGPMGAVVPISTATNTPGKPIRIGSAVTIGITPDGKTLYAAAAGKVVPISTATNTPGKPIRIPVRDAHPSGVVVP
jgi:DNA-binding beta-propeller fold protein YncE